MMKGQPTTGPFLDLVRLTLLGALHQPVALLITILTVIGSALIPLIQLTSFGEHGKLARDGAMALHLLLGTLLASFLGAQAIRTDARNGIASTILSKPLSPTRYFIASYVGISTVLLLYSVPATIAALLSERIAEAYDSIRQEYIIDTTVGAAVIIMPLFICLVAAIKNRLHRTNFSTSAFRYMVIGSLLLILAAGCIDRSGHLASFDLRIDERILNSSCLITMALLMMAAIAISLSTLGSTAATLASMTSLLFLGLLWDYFFGTQLSSSLVMRILSIFLPNWQNFWMTDALDAGGKIPFFYLGCALGHAALYSSAVLCVGSYIFRNKATG
jgi:hypothetical protein